MLEADVVLKGQGTQQQQLVAVMAHPPAVDSDLTIEEWLQLSAPSGKGIKLDFKSIEAVEISLQKLQSLKTQVLLKLSDDCIHECVTCSDECIKTTCFTDLKTDVFFPCS